MELTYEPSVDTAYIYLAGPRPDTRVTSTSTVPEHPGLILDWNGDVLVGIEVLGASTILPDALLTTALT
jgi:uncharacterized protein YuzE